MNSDAIPGRSQKICLCLKKTGHRLQAFLIQHEANAVEFMGNRTECALLMLLRGWGVRYEATRSEHKAAIFQVYNFSSERKMASVLLRHGDRLRLYNKVRHTHSAHIPPQCLRCA